jgi:DNA processing protein
MPGTGQEESYVELSDEQKLAWLRLFRSENVGGTTFRDLLNHFGSATAALDAIPDLSRRGGSRRTIKICSMEDAERELKSIAAAGAHLVAIGEHGYPLLLRHVDAPPPLLTIRGSKEIFNRPAVAIVGSRNCSISGKKMAVMLARDLGEAGFAIVSGLARGIDTAAHESSLPTGTIAVLAGGIDHIYPASNEPLYHAMLAQDGAIMTEMPIGHNVRPQDFPRRNRLISGSAYGVVVIEAATKSGSLYTARFATEQGREVFAVPGSPLDPRSAGCNKLIKDGAALVRSAEDVIVEIQPLIGRPPPERSSAREEDGEQQLPLEPAEDDARRQVTGALDTTPVDIDEIIRHTGLRAAVVQLILLELDLAGRLERHGGQKVSLIP